MPTEQLVLEYLKVFLAAPAMGAAVAIVFFVVFRKSISTLISKIGTIKLPGGGELQTTQQEQAAIALQTGGAKPPESLPSPASTALPAGGTQADLQDRIKAEREAAYLWEYRYLNHYLVHNTQRVLDWLDTRDAPTTFSNYTAWLSDAIPEANERTAILSALQKHHLIQIDDGLIRVTPKGKEYRTWRGPLPQGGA